MIVYKYPVSFDGRPVEMPKGSRILHVGWSNDILCFWALVDPEAEIESRAIYTVGTGWEQVPVAETDIHLGTSISRIGLVWHVFERPTSGDSDD